jgi:hypothetical protein
MKISWGHKIAFVYLAFVGGIAFLVIKASSQKFDLVTKDYYGEELKYQQVIDQSANANKLSAPVAVVKNNGSLTIRFPDEMLGKKKQVDFYLYYPADARKDFRKSIEVSSAEFTETLPQNISGSYELKLSWKADNVKYYHEQKIFF